jgi:hypothetical protein
MTNANQPLVDAIRDVAASVQKAIADVRRGGLFRALPFADGPFDSWPSPRRQHTPLRGRSRAIDADDLVEVLLAIADCLDPPVRDEVAPECACPECGERHVDRLVWEDDLVRCASCGITFDPAATSAE